MALNLVTELAGAALIYVLFELFIALPKEQQAKREAEEKERIAKEEERAARKADLIAQMGSTERSVAIPAAEEVVRHRWHTDGSLRWAYLWQANLQGAELSFANLQGAELSFANLQGAHLRGANLQRAYLDRAQLQGAHLRDANLQGASLGGANLQGAHLRDANLQGAKFSERTTLPDGTKWTPDTDMARFTDPDHPDFCGPSPWPPEE